MSIRGKVLPNGSASKIEGSYKFMAHLPDSFTRRLPLKSHTAIFYKSNRARHRAVYSNIGIRSEIRRSPRPDHSTEVARCFIYFFSSCLVAVDKYDGEQLNLTKITRTEMGAYLCIATNGVPPTVSKRITVDVECEYLFSCLLSSILLNNFLTIQ